MIRWVIYSAVLAVLAKGGISEVPECNPDPNECLKSVGTAFADAVQIRLDGDYDTVRANPTLKNAMCSPNNWRLKSEVCGQCHYTLHIVDPPGYEQNPICIQDYFSHPYNSSVHMHAGHPLDGKILPIRSSSGDKCTAEGWGDMTESIALMSFHKMPRCDVLDASLESGASIAIMGLEMGGSSQRMGNHFPAWQVDSWGHAAAKANALIYYGLADAFLYVEELLANNVSVTAKVQYNCNAEIRAFPETADTSEYYDDGCPWWFLHPYKMCADMDDPKARLCSVCPLQVYENESSTQQVSCLYGPDFTPSRREYFLHAQHESPGFVDVLYIPRLMPLVCVDFEFLPEELEGRVIASIPGPCSVHEFLKKVPSLKGLIGVGSDRPHGWGSNISVASAWTGGESDQERLQAFLNTSVPRSVTIVKTSGESIVLDVYERRMYLKQGVYSTEVPEVLETDQTELKLPDKDEMSVFEENGVLVSLILLPFLVFGVATKAFMDYRSTEGSNVREVQGVSLTWSSTALSLTLVLVVAGLAFGLSYDAGRRGVRASSDDAKKALNDAAERGTYNVKMMSSQLLGQILHTSVSAYEKWKGEAILIADALAGFTRMKQTPNYTQFKAIRKDVAKALENQKDRGSSFMNWEVQLLMRNGFYYDSKGNTNGKFDGNGNEMDGNETNAFGYGFLVSGRYEVNRSAFNPFSKIFLSSIDDNTDNAVEYVSNNLNEYRTRKGWVHYSALQREEESLRSRSTNGQEPLGPCYSIIMPIMTERSVRDQKMIGILTLSLSGYQLSQEIKHDISNNLLRNPLAENMSVYILDKDGTIFASFEEGFSILDTIDGQARGRYGHHTYSMPSISNSRSPRIVSLANEIKARYGTWIPPDDSDQSGKVLTFEFDQKDKYTEVPTQLMHLPFDGHLRDESGNAWDVVVQRSEVHALGNFSEEMPFVGNNSASLRFDGNTYVKVFPHLTLRVPRIHASIDGNTHLPKDPQYHNVCTVDGIPDALCYQSQPIIREVFTYKSPYTIAMYIKPDLEDDGKGQLFSDSLSSSASVRFLSNGLLIVSVLKHACITKPVRKFEGWTHIAGSVNFFKGSCVVYVDGEEVSRGSFSLRYDIEFATEGFFVGVGYKGLVDDFRVFNHSMGRYCVQKMIATRKHFSSVGSKRYTASVLPRYEVKGLPGTLHITMVPTEDIIGGVNSFTTAIADIATINKENTEAKLYRKSVETVLVTCVIVLVATLVFLIFNEMMTKPFVSFAHDINQIAMMELEKIDVEDFPVSLLKEINMMRRAMRVLIRNMREYKSFMPMSVVGYLEDEDVKKKHPSDGSHIEAVGTDMSDSASSISAAFSIDDDDDDDAEGGRELHVPSTVSPRSKVYRKAYQDHNMQSSLSPTSASRQQDSVQRKGRSRSRRRRGTQSAALLLSPSLSNNKRMSFVVVNIVGFHQLFTTMSDKSVIVTHTDYIHKVVEHCQHHRGIPDTFSGDRVLLTFNGIKRCTSHASFAALCALGLQAMWDASPTVKLSMSVASGSVRAGHIGAASMKRYCMLGPIVPWAFALERFCRHEGYGILTNSRVVESSKCLIRFKHSAAVVFLKLSDRAQMVSRIISTQSTEHTEVEWLYLNDPQSDPNLLWNDFFKLVATEKRMEVDDFFEAHKQDLLRCAETAAEQSFLQEIEDGSYRPSKILYC